MNLLPAKEVMARCGGVSQMTIWRWLKDPAVGFPEPRYIKTRRYWREDDLTAWLDGQRAN
jgi:predicted DNA-binding transcriptional regulator AlpA